MVSWHFLGLYWNSLEKAILKYKGRLYSGKGHLSYPNINVILYFIYIFIIVLYSTATPLPRNKRQTGWIPGWTKGPHALPVSTPYKNKKSNLLDIRLTLESTSCPSLGSEDSLTLERLKVGAQNHCPLPEGSTADMEVLEVSSEWNPGPWAQAAAASSPVLHYPTHVPLTVSLVTASVPREPRALAHLSACVHPGLSAPNAPFFHLCLTDASSGFLARLLSCPLPSIKK